MIQFVHFIKEILTSIIHWSYPLSAEYILCITNSMIDVFLFVASHSSFLYIHMADTLDIRIKPSRTWCLCVMGGQRVAPSSWTKAGRREIVCRDPVCFPLPWPCPVSHGHGEVSHLRYCLWSAQHPSCTHTKQSWSWEAMWRHVSPWWEPTQMTNRLCCTVDPMMTITPPQWWQWCSAASHPAFHC